MYYLYVFSLILAAAKLAGLITISWVSVLVPAFFALGVHTLIAMAIVGAVVAYFWGR